MGELLVQVLPKKPADSPALRAQVARKNLLTDVAGEEKRIADVPGDTRRATRWRRLRAARPSRRCRARSSRRALRSRPIIAMAHYNLGVIAMGDQRVRRGESRGSSGRWRRGPTTPRRTTISASRSKSIGRGAEAEPQYRAAIGLRPEPRRGPQQSRTGAAGARRRLPKRLAHSARRSGPGPTIRTCSTTSGARWLANGQPREAVQQWRRALAARPDSVADC